MSALVGAENVPPGEDRIARGLIPAAWRYRPLLVVQPGSAEEVIGVVKAVEAYNIALLPCDNDSRRTNIGTNYAAPVFIQSSDSVP